VKLELRAITSTLLIPGESSDDLFDHPTGEIFLLGIATEALEG